jgi:transcriptional regulator with XRE-family HTH domain
MGVVDIARFLTKRLQKITGDRNAERSYSSIIGRMQKIGLQTADVLGGITTTQAAKEINSRATINHVISNKQLRAFRIGRLWVIPHDVWAEWKAGRVFPPKGYVQLSTLKKPLSIKSDKLSEWARAGLVPSAVRCNPYGTKVRSTQFGTWFIDKKVADKLVADRRAGKPMPWHTKSDPGNLRVTFKLWQERKHPASCSTCKEIWGKKGAPNSFDEYMLRYPPLAHGAKRHLTRQWSPGLTINEVAAASGCSVPTVAYAIKTGTLRAHKEGACLYISRTDATRWKARRCPTGDGTKSWISIDTACQLYLFTQSELKEFVDSGQLNSKIGAEGGQRGIIYELRQQCRELREKIGFTEEEAAARVGVSVPRFRRLLDGVDWRNAEKIPLVTVQAVIKRLKSRAGYTIEEAAIKTGMPEQWVQERIKDGTIRIAKAPWDLRRTYISEPMINLLLSAKNNPEEKNYGDDWLLLSDAAEEAGVSTSQIIMWSDNGELKRRKSIIGWRYHRNAVRARARVYWGKCRFVRAEPPSWLKLEMVAAAV